MHALIDMDIIQYEFGNAVEEDGVTPLDWQYVRVRVDDRISGILENTDATSYQGYLTSTDKSNFRYKVATIKPYKGNRTLPKPYYYDAIREYLLTHYKAVEVFGIEADDKLGIEQCKLVYWNMHDVKNSVICTLDKDLNMIPGWHYNWRKNQLWWINENDSLLSFYSQLCTGDTIDNIPGLYGVGRKSSILSKLSDCSTELSMYSIVRTEYEKRFGAYWKQFLNENAELLWILRDEPKDGMYQSQVLYRLECLEDEFEDALLLQ